jgi:hypothetical protein
MDIAGEVAFVEEVDVADEVVGAELNPPLIIDFNVNVTERNCSVNVIRDDYLLGGTKQRAMGTYLDSKMENEFVYAGPVCGAAQVALAYACKCKNKKCTIIVSKQPNGMLNENTILAKKLGANIIVSKFVMTLKDLNNETKKYLSQNKKAFLVPFGVEDKDYTDSLINSINEAKKGTYLENNFPKRLWVVAGSSTLLNVFAKIWPDTHFLVLQVGKKIWPDQRGILNGVEIFKSTLYVSPQFFYEFAKVTPPYPSNSNYDAKLWSFIQKHAEEGDFVWNVAK